MLLSSPNIFQESFNEILSQLLIHDRSYLYSQQLSYFARVCIYRIYHELAAEIKFY